VLGLLTHTVAPKSYGEIVAALADSQPVDAVLDGLQEDFGAPALAPYRSAMVRCFSASSVEGVVSKLAAETGAEAAWARATLTQLERQSVPELSAIHRIVTQAAASDLRESLFALHRTAVELLVLADPLMTDKNSMDFFLPTRADIAIGRF
jgi:hypothetical protein